MFKILKNIAEILVADRNQLNTSSTLGTYSSNHNWNRKLSERPWQLWEQFFRKKHHNCLYTNSCPSVPGAWRRFSPLSPASISTWSPVPRGALHIVFLNSLCFAQEVSVDFYLTSLAMAKTQQKCFFVGSHELRPTNASQVSSSLRVTSITRTTFHLATVNVREGGAGHSSWYILWK